MAWILSSIWIAGSLMTLLIVFWRAARVSRALKDQQSTIEWLNEDIAE